MILDPAADGEGGEDDGQVGFDRDALAVLDRPALQVAKTHGLQIRRQGCQQCSSDAVGPHVRPNAEVAHVSPMAAWSLNWLTTAKPATVRSSRQATSSTELGERSGTFSVMGRENSKLATSIVTVSWGWRPYQLVRE